MRRLLAGGLGRALKPRHQQRGGHAERGLVADHQHRLAPVGPAGQRQQRIDAATGPQRLARLELAAQRLRGLLAA